MGLFDQFLTGPPEDAAPATSSVPATPPPDSVPGFDQFLRGPPEPAGGRPPVSPPVRQFNEPFGSLTSYTPSWTEWVKNKGQDALMALGAQPYVAGHLAGGAVDATKALVAPVAVALGGADAQHYAGQGDFGNAALSAINVIPAGRIGNAAIGEVAKTLPPNFAKPELGEVFRAAPTTQELLDSGVAGFEKYRGSGQTYSTQFGKDLLNDARSVASVTDDKTHKVLDAFKDKVDNQPFLTAKDIDNLRLELGAASKKGESSAMRGRTVLYDKLEQTGDTTMQKAVGDYAAGSRGGMVDTVLDKAARRDDVAKALASQTRSLVESTEKRPRGFLQSEIDALDAARKGSRGVRALETASDVVSGTGTAGKLIRGVLAGGGVVGSHILGGDLTQAAIGGSVPYAVAALGPEAAGGLLRRGAGALREREVAAVGDLVRQRSPMFLDTQAANIRDQLVYPGSPAQIMRNAITQELTRRRRGY